MQSECLASYAKVRRQCGPNPLSAINSMSAMTEDECEVSPRVLVSAIQCHFEYMPPVRQNGTIEQTLTGY